MTTATTQQHLNAELAIRFKAIKMGATHNEINAMTTYEVLDWISNNA